MPQFICGHALSINCAQRPLPVREDQNLHFANSHFRDVIFQSSPSESIS